MTLYTKFRKIDRDDNGIITPTAGWSSLHSRGLPGAPQSVSSHEVASVEPDVVLGWGDASAIGTVVAMLDGQAIGPPFLAFLA